MQEQFISIYDQKLCDLFRKLYGYIDAQYQKINNEPDELEKLKLLAAYQEEIAKIKEEIKRAEMQRRKINKSASSNSNEQFKLFSGLSGSINAEARNELLMYRTKKDYYASLENEIAKIAEETVLSHVVGRVTKADNIAYYANMKVVYSLINELYNKLNDANLTDEVKVAEIANFDESISSYKKLIIDSRKEYEVLRSQAKEVNPEKIDYHLVEAIEENLMTSSYGEISLIMNNETSYNDLMEWKENKKQSEEFSAKIKSVKITEREAEYHKTLEMDFKQLLVYLLEKKANDKIIEEFKKEKTQAKSNVSLLELVKKMITYIHNYYDETYQLDSNFKYDYSSQKKSKKIA